MVVEAQPVLGHNSIEQTNHSLYTPARVASAALELIVQQIEFLSTCNRNYESNYGGGRGQSVIVKVPPILTAYWDKIRSEKKVKEQSVEEGLTNVTIDDEIINLVKLTRAELTFDINNFTKQVLDPQALAIVEGVEGYLIDTLESKQDLIVIRNAANNEITQKLEVKGLPQAGFYWNTEDITQTFIDARKALRDFGLPLNGLYAIVGTNIASKLLKSDIIRKANEAGRTAGFTKAVIGQIAGFTVLENNRMHEDHGFFYNKNTVTVAIRAPEIPVGAPFGKSISGKGFAVSYMRDYIPINADDGRGQKDMSVLNTYVGSKLMTVKLTQPRNIWGKEYKAGEHFIPGFKVVFESETKKPDKGEPKKR